MNIQLTYMKIRRLLATAACVTGLIAFAAQAEAGIEEHIIETEAGFYYTVQKGDTLWDLSEKFADSPWQWPEMWHYNPDIQNPHLIYPGQRIQVYKKGFGDEMPAPEPVAAEAPLQAETEFTYSQIQMVGFIRKDAVEPAGTVFESVGDRFLISSTDQVYIQPTEGQSLEIGQRHYVYRTIDPVRHPDTNAYVGVQHFFTGILEITDIRADFAVGRLLITFEEVREGHMIMPYHPRDEKFVLKPGIKGLDGTIVKAEAGWNIIGENMIAFIDKGRDHGVEVGQMYNVYYQMINRPDEWSAAAPMKLTEEEIGRLIVIHTEKTTATVLVTYSAEEMSAGMIIHATR